MPLKHCSWILNKYIASVVLWILYFLLNGVQNLGVSALLVGPKNAAEVKGNPVEFSCSTDGESRLQWSVKRFEQNGEVTLTRKSMILPQFSNHYSVTSTNGRLDLVINHTEPSDAGRYICQELSTSKTASAELTVFESLPICNTTHAKSTATCDVSYKGALEPHVELRLPEKYIQVLDTKGHSKRQFNISNIFDFSTAYYACTISFNENGISKAHLTPEKTNNEEGTVAKNPPIYSDMTVCVLSLPMTSAGLKHLGSLFLATNSILFAISRS